MRRKNYIGEAVIAERDDEDEGEDPGIKKAQQAPSTMAKRSRIAKLCDESLQQYKEQQISS